MIIKTGSVIYHRIVQWGETDAAGIVFYPNFYKWMDEATHHLFREKGYSVSDFFHKQKIAMPILETHCSFKSPAFFEDKLQIESMVDEVKEKVFKVSHRFWRGEQLLAEGYELRAWADFSEGKPKAVSIPDEHRKWMEQLQDDRLDE